MSKNIMLARPMFEKFPARALPLKISDLHGIFELGRIEDESFILERSSKGYRLKEPLIFKIEKILRVGQRGVVEYVFRALLPERPGLIPFVLENESVLALAKYFLRYRTGSLHSLYSYTDSISRYALFLGKQPDAIIEATENESVETHVKILEDFIGQLQDDGLTPGRVHGYAKHVKTFYRVNGLSVNLPYPLSRKVTFKDRAPKPEELAKLLDIANLREKVIICLMALAGFREGTLSQLEYRHVREDLEKGIVPVHIHVEPEITKGRYHDYDTFLGTDGAEYLKLYIVSRKKGSPDGKIPPEELSDESPLLRDENSRAPKPIGPKQIRKLIHNLYLQAGLIKPSNRRMYDLRAHSLRKYFKTQLEALGVNRDYIEYMMGHTISIYHDVQMKGVEFLRGIYAASGLSIRPKTKISKLDMLKEIARSLGLDPEKILVQEAVAEPHRLVVNGTSREENQLKVLAQALKTELRKELLQN